LKAAHAFRIWGGRVIVISTHDGKSNPFNQICEDARTGRKEYKLHTITLLDAVAQGLCKRVFEVTGREWTQETEDAWVADLLSSDGAEEEFLCIPSSSEGTYFSMPVVDARMYRDYKVVRWRLDEDFKLREESRRVREVDNWLKAHIDPVLTKLPKAFCHFLGQDFGRSSDMSAIAIGYLDGEDDLHVPLIVELRNMPYEQQKQVLFHILSAIPRFSRACLDSTGNGAYLGEVAVQKFGENQIDAVKMNDPWYAENLPKCRARFDDNTILIPFDLDVRGDLAMFEVINGVPKLPKVKQRSVRPGQKELRHGDCGIALACLTTAASQPKAKIKYEKVEKRGGLWRSREGITI
jgi:phage FluMu gp28-like protein